MNFQYFLTVFLLATFVLHAVAFTILGLKRRKPHYFFLTGTFTLLTAIYIIKLGGRDIRGNHTGIPATWVLRAGATICTLGYLRCLYREKGSWFWKLTHRGEKR